MEDRELHSCVKILPREMRGAVQAYCDANPKRWEEIRLRAGRGVGMVCDGQETELFLSQQPMLVTPQDLRTVLELATGASYQSAAEQLRQGFYTMRGGHRIGVCGSAAVQNGEIHAIREFSSLTIRIARPWQGILGELEQGLLVEGIFPSTLILSPPGMGKTTLLRELIHSLSDHFGMRVSLADERGEVAALWRGVPQFPVGIRTDVLEGCPKAEGMLMLLRSMNPQVLCADEITAPKDIEAIAMAANCGVSVLATAHGASLEELQRRTLYRTLLAQQVFQRVIFIQRMEDGSRQYRMERIVC